MIRREAESLSRRIARCASESASSNRPCIASAGDDQPTASAASESIRFAVSKLATVGTTGVIVNRWMNPRAE